MSEWAQTLGAVAGSGTLASLVTGILGRRARRKQDNARALKFDADAVHVIADTAVGLVSPLKEQVAELSGRVEHLEDENTTTKNRLAQAIEYIRELRAWVRTHLPEGDPPAPPPSLDIRSAA